MSKRYIPTWRNMQWVVLDRETGRIWNWGNEPIRSRENACDFAEEMNEEEN